ncbi:phytoene/squalene synthase family protein [Humisphaera borealis]|uniref:Phytoene/squalene synthase family protein n=1 Tax=Humisphaera borealis TaxID=2807512 RepID=A0A7M2WX80_9BACT|nr:phytoene/squalene synthase family protein [Humisphaera borealis]QOV90086.1 phytoene/squalene synthase family protein [Humisphaera borealis]
MLQRLIAPDPVEFDPLRRAAFIAARDICRRNARSFYFASHFLPLQKRYAAYAVYAFCRLLDDAIDLDAESSPPAGVTTPAAGEARLARLSATLDRFRATLDRAYAAGNDEPSSFDQTSMALHAFSLTVRRYRIDKQHFLDLAEGCRMDLTVSRYATWKDLERYCYLVAGVVGLIMCPIFGLGDARAVEQAVLMGNAMQLTNILRDVRQDWELGRVYLPLEDLDRFGYQEADIATGVVDDRFRRLMRFEIDRARDLYMRGAAGLCHLASDGSRLTASAMAVIYSGILGAIERAGYDVYASRAHLTTAQKLARLPSAWRLSRRDAGDVVPAVF